MITRFWIFAMLAIGCSHTNTGPVPPPQPPLGCKSDPPTERCYGVIFDTVLTAFTPNYEDDKLSQYITAIGQRLAAHTGRPEIVWTFRLIDDPAVRAWPTVGGYVYIYRGALAYLDSEAELAALLAHEIAHVVADHQTLQTLAGEETRNRVQMRDNEYQADGLAVIYLRRAGYTTMAVPSMLGKLLLANEARRPAQNIDPHFSSNEDTHPPALSRIAHTMRLANGGTGQAHRDRYIAQLDGLVVGSNTRRGHLGNQHYVWLNGGLTAEVPDNWKLNFSAGAVVGQHSLEPLTLEIRVVPDALTETICPKPATKLSRDLAGYPSMICRIENTTGLVEIAAAIYTKNGVLRLAVKGKKRKMVEEKLNEVLKNIRQPTPAELAEVEPDRIAVVRVDRAGSIGELTRRLCTNPEIAIQFSKNLNERLEPGNLLKCTAKHKPTPSSSTRKVVFDGWANSSPVPLLSMVCS